MIRDFLDKSKRTLKRIDVLYKIVDEMKECIRMKQTSVLNEDKEQILDGKMDELDTKFDTICQEIKTIIAERQDETDQLEKTGELDKFEVEMRKVHVYKYYKGLSGAIESYRNLKTDFKNKEKELLRQAYQIVHPRVTADELDKLVEEPEGENGLKVFGAGTTTGQQMVAHAITRGKRIADISRKTMKLIAMIDEISELASKNTRQIDDIVINITKAEIHTKAANKELEDALKYQRRINMVKRIVALVFVILILVVLLFIAFSDPVTAFLAGLLVTDDSQNASEIRSLDRRERNDEGIRGDEAREDEARADEDVRRAEDEARAAERAS